jgi:membrane-bound serine protease (ClpP class)
MRSPFTRKFLCFSALLIIMGFDLAIGQSDSVPKVFVFEIKEEIAKPAWRTTMKAIDEANQKGMDFIILHLNTYGGRVDIADSIRTKILNNPIPVIAFIDNQAISAGSLISIACDSIFMRPGGSIGAATVVSQTGEVVPDKYQSFMRSTMRATAEAHGKDTIIRGNDTILIWHRDPKVAEAMVDPKIAVPGISDSGQVLTLTAEEAMKANYCEGLAESIPDLLKKIGLGEAKVYHYEKDASETLISLLLSTGVQSILIILIIGGIYFELQTPGVGFPLGIAVAGALLYFAPLYIEGLAQNWELIAFIVGLILIALEIFVIPGFGIAGVAGIILVVTGLTMSLIDNVVFEFEGVAAYGTVVKLFARVILTVLVSFVLSIYFSKKVGTSTWFKGFALESVQQRSDGFISIDVRQKEMIGKIGIAYTVLRPSGKVMVENTIFDARSEIGFIDKGDKIKVIRDEAGQLYVIKS